jgi:hypothetical protein
MNRKALAALVGTLSLGSLATGCATTKTAQQTSGADSKATEGQSGKKSASAEAGCTAYDPGKGGK